MALRRGFKAEAGVDRRCHALAVRQYDELWCAACGPQLLPGELEASQQAVEEMEELRRRYGRQKWRRPTRGGIKL